MNNSRNKKIYFILLSSLISIAFMNNVQQNYFISKTRKKPANLHLNYVPEDEGYNSKSITNHTQKELLSPIGNLESVWDEVTGKGITVAVIDSGLDCSHLDFQNNVLDESCYIYTKYDELDKEKYEIKYQIGKDYIFHEMENNKIINHGTSVSGVICAENNAYGIIGIAFNSKLLNIKCDLETPSVNAAIKYAVDNGARVINISAGGYAAPYYDGVEKKIHDVEGIDYCKEDAYLMIDGINYAYENNVIIVASAGNEKTCDSSYPASNNHVIGVGALDILSSTQLSYYSNYNKDSYDEGTYPNVDIVAPGTVITSTSNVNNSNSSDINIKSGTSFSAPIISASAALWLEKHPNGTPDQFEEALFNSANDLGENGFDKYYGHGLLNINSLIDYKSIEKIDIEDEIILKVGEEKQIQYNVYPNNIDYDISFISSDEGVAIINELGLIKAVSPGEAIITIEIGKISEICRVIVKNEDKNTSGCGGEIILTSAILSFLSLLGIILILTKKKPYFDF